MSLMRADEDLCARHAGLFCRVATKDGAATLVYALSEHKTHPMFGSRYNSFGVYRVSENGRRRKAKHLPPIIPASVVSWAALAREPAICRT